MTHYEFSRLLDAACVSLGISNEDVSNVLPVSVTAVARWRCGASAPLPLMQKPVLRFLARKLMEKADQ